MNKYHLSIGLQVTVLYKIIYIYIKFILLLFVFDLAREVYALMGIYNVESINIYSFIHHCFLL
jgi:hypothetical protein